MGSRKEDVWLLQNSGREPPQKQIARQKTVLQPFGRRAIGTLVTPHAAFRPPALRMLHDTSPSMTDWSCQFQTAEHRLSSVFPRSPRRTGAGHTGMPNRSGGDDRARAKSNGH